LLLSYLLLIAIIILAIPVVIFLTQVLFAFFTKGKGTEDLSQKHRPEVTIIMPAHNEALVITESIKSVNAQLRPKDQLLVVADNCTDETASIALSLGAKVIERNDQQNRGKGYALDFGLQSLKAERPEVVMVVDADCLLGEHSVDRLVAFCHQYERPVQALYLMEPNPNPSLKERISSFAWVVKNHVRPLGFKVINLPCQLMGTGMAFLWEDINQVSLASGHIVEDMKLGSDLARINKAPLFLESAVVTSVFPTDAVAANTQRARWEHGHMSVILSEAPKLFGEAVKNRNLQAFGLVCDLLVPPLAMLALMCFALFLFSLILTNTMAIALSAVLLSCLMVAVSLAWIKFGRSIISFKQLCYAPIYAFVKIPLYIKFFFNRQVEWVRSKRG